MSALGLTSKEVAELAILVRMELELHSLNNEGTNGNITNARTVTLADGTEVDAISGEKMKHIHAELIWQEAISDGIPLCPACESFLPQRVEASLDTLDSRSKFYSMAKAINQCVICDLHGFMVPQIQARRRSVIGFSWARALKDKSHCSYHLHARHAIADGEDEKSAQMIFHRPTRSGEYAMLIRLEPWRIGFNEASLSYAIDYDEQTRRYKLALEAIKYTLLRPDGAMISTRYPHIIDIAGVILASPRLRKIPTLSPAQDDYLDRIKAIKDTQNNFEYWTFSGHDQLMKILEEIKNSTVPFRPPRLTQKLPHEYVIKDSTKKESSKVKNEAHKNNDSYEEDEE